MFSSAHALYIASSGTNRQQIVKTESCQKFYIRDKVHNIGQGFRNYILSIAGISSSYTRNFMNDYIDTTSRQDYYRTIFFIIIGYLSISKCFDFLVRIYIIFMIFLNYKQVISCYTYLKRIQNQNGKKKANLCSMHTVSQP